jgi:hypothetical protein
MVAMTDILTLGVPPVYRRRPEIRRRRRSTGLDVADVVPVPHEGEFRQVTN